MLEDVWAHVSQRCLEWAKVLRDRMSQDGAHSSLSFLLIGWAHDFFCSCKVDSKLFASQFYLSLISPLSFVLPVKENRSTQRKMIRHNVFPLVLPQLKLGFPYFSQSLPIPQSPPSKLINDRTITIHVFIHLIQGYVYQLPIFSPLIQSKWLTYHQLCQLFDVAST